MKILVSLAAILLTCYVLAAAYLYFKQRSFIYFPSRIVEHPHPIRAFAFNAATINVIEINAGQSDAILYFGGNAENVVFTAPEFTELFPDHTLYLVNYRGYGGSTGQPSERALYSDAEAIFDALMPAHRHIAVIGKSLGSGVASWLASVRDIKQLVLVTPYDSIANLAAASYPIFPVHWLLQDKFDSVGRATKINAQTLVIVAQNDRIIPLSHSANLVAAFPAEQVAVKSINNADHNSIAHDEAYYLALKEFLSD